MTYIVLGIIFLCLYVVGIPLVMFLLLWRNKKHLHDESSPKHHLIKNALGGMYTQYEPSFWWFEIFLLINKTMMCGGLVMAAPGTPLQVLIAMLIMLFHLLIVLKTSPYDSDGEDVSSFKKIKKIAAKTLHSREIPVGTEKLPILKRSSKNSKRRIICRNRRKRTKRRREKNTSLPRCTNTNDCNIFFCIK